MAKKITLRDKQKNQLIPVTRATVVEMNNGDSVQVAYDGINLTHYTKDEINAAAYISTEMDPTVPSYVKSILESDIENWSSNVVHKMPEAWTPWDFFDMDTSGEYEYIPEDSETQDAFNEMCENLYDTVSSYSSNNVGIYTDDENTWEIHPLSVDDENQYINLRTNRDGWLWNSISLHKDLSENNWSANISVDYFVSYDEAAAVYHISLNETTNTLRPTYTLSDYAQEIYYIVYENNKVPVLERIIDGDDENVTLYSFVSVSREVGNSDSYIAYFENEDTYIKILDDTVNFLNKVDIPEPLVVNVTQAIDRYYYADTRFTTIFNTFNNAFVVLRYENKLYQLSDIKEPQLFNLNGYAKFTNISSDNDFVIIDTFIIDSTSIYIDDNGWRVSRSSQNVIKNLYNGDFSEWDQTDITYLSYAQSPYSTYAFVKRELTSYVSKSELSYASYVTTYSLENIVTYNSYNPVTSYAVYNAIEKKSNSIEIFDELPDPTTYTSGTTCILYKATEIENGDPVIFPIMVSGLPNQDLNDEQNQHDIDIALLDTNNRISLCMHDTGIIDEYNPDAQIEDNWLNYKPYGDDIQIYNGDDCRYSWETSAFNISVSHGQNANFYHLDILTYINNGTSWVNLNDLTSHQDPDENIIVDDVENPPLYAVEYDKHIYCSVEPLNTVNFSMDSWEEDSPYVLCVHNAERFLNTEEYVPVLMRKCKHKNGMGAHWGWKQYIPSMNTGYNGYKSDFRDDGIYIVPTTDKFDISNGKPFQGVFIINEPIKYFPHVTNNGTNCPTIAHGCNTIDLLRKNINDEVIAITQYRAHWGISFIKKSDWPRNDRPLDFNKLVTNIAEFKILYIIEDWDVNNDEYNYMMRFLV